MAAAEGSVGVGSGSTRQVERTPPSFLERGPPSPALASRAGALLPSGAPSAVEGVDGAPPLPASTLDA
jgi:hypothetical protein